MLVKTQQLMFWELSGVNKEKIMNEKLYEMHQSRDKSK